MGNVCELHVKLKKKLTSKCHQKVQWPVYCASRSRKNVVLAIVIDTLETPSLTVGSPGKGAQASAVMSRVDSSWNVPASSVHRTFI